MEWTAAREVGYPVIEKQHRLVAILAQVLANMNKPDGRAALLDAYSQLADYASMHFAMEEELMAERRYPGALEHKRAHAELASTVRALEAELKAGKQMIVIGSKTVFFLQTWIRDHVQKTDREFAKFLSAGQKAA